MQIKLSEQEAKAGDAFVSVLACFCCESDVSRLLSEEKKLFIGMLPKTFSAEDVREVFVKFGEVEEVNVLHDVGGVSRGGGKFQLRIAPFTPGLFVCRLCLCQIVLTRFV